MKNEQHGRFVRYFGDGFKCFERPRQSMERKAKALFILGLLLVQCVAAHGASRRKRWHPILCRPNGAESFDPVMGGSVGHRVMLYNSQQSDAFNVEVAVYKENIAQSNRLFLDHGDHLRRIVLHRQHDLVGFDRRHPQGLV